MRVKWGHFGRFLSLNDLALPNLAVPLTPKRGSSGQTTALAERYTSHIAFQATTRKNKKKKER